MHPAAGLLLLLPLGASPTIVGRWDLTVHAPPKPYPSWFEVTPGPGGLTGRYQGIYGHATALSAVVQAGDSFHLVWPDEGRPKEPPTRIDGRLIGADSLEGVFAPPTGPAVRFTGSRAPRLAARPAPVWASPIDLLAEGIAGWTPRDPDKTKWVVRDAVLDNPAAGSDLVSNRRFGDFKLHVEVNVPPGGNSGIYLRGRHEVQVQDSWGRAPHSREMGGIYGQVTPTSLPARKAGEWQTFDITLVGRQVTVVLNGVTIIDRQEIPGITGGALDSDEASPGPLMLQGDHGPIRYRNVVITPRRDVP